MSTPAEPLTPIAYVVPSEDPVVDARGLLQNLGSTPFGSILRLESKKGAVRGNHYHDEECHWAWLASGRVRYTWRDHVPEVVKYQGGAVTHADCGYGHEPGTPCPPEPVSRSIEVGPNVLIKSPPGVEHAFEFLEDSVMYTVSTPPRDQRSYEAQVHRVPLVTVPESGLCGKPCDGQHEGVLLPCVGPKNHRRNTHTCAACLRCQLWERAP